VGELEAYDRLVGALDAPMFIVTTEHAGTRAGCLIGFASQVSIDPRRFLVCLSDKNRTYRVAAGGATHLAVHLVPTEARELAELFGGETGDDVDKFSRCSWSTGPRGLPILDDCPDWFAGRVLDQRVLGDHVGFLLEPVAARFAGASRLRLEQSLDIDPGHEA
jgi:flavin reductase (DIM6/NTAB) family NADH-FMN oxidoreductase RutF